VIYNTSNILEKKQARVKFDYLLENNKVIELIEKKPKRSIKQNSYLHLILTWFAIETGNTLEDVKIDLYKKFVNPAIFIRQRKDIATGKLIETLRSSASLDSKEMTLSIDRFRNYSSKEAGVYLPQANEYDFLNHIRNEEKRHQEYV